MEPFDISTSTTSRRQGVPDLLGLGASRGFNRPRDLHGNGRDICDLRLVHSAEFAVLGGSHGAYDAGSGLNELCGFHDDFLVFAYSMSSIFAR
jgi:hypothetical protein